MRVVVVGATGGSGRAVVEALVKRGHTVTAFARRVAGVAFPDGVRVLAGDVMRQADCDAAVAGQDAVVVALGIQESAVRVRLFGPARTAANVRSVGTAHILDAMRRHGVRKLVVQTSFGVGATRARLPLKWRMIFAALLKPQIDDTEIQEQHVRASGLTWVVAQPVALTDDRDEGAPFMSTEGEVRSMAVSRRRVATFMADAVESTAYDGQVVSLS